MPTEAVEPGEVFPTLLADDALGRLPAFLRSLRRRVIAHHEVEESLRNVEVDFFLREQVVQASLVSCE